MLTSADAKWKCMWYMLVWSIQLTLVSSFLQVHNHIAFYLFAAISVILLPMVTAIYSNTAGRHGAGLLRAGLVFCDPVLSCLTVTPVLLLNHLPVVVDQYRCVKASTDLNETQHCTANGTQIRMFGKRATNQSAAYNVKDVLHVKQGEFLIIQASVVIPILLVLMMGRRTRKMSVNAYLLVFAYWFIIAVEAGTLLEILLISDVYKHVIFTTEAVTCIAMIAINTYAVVTLCSYINPRSFVDSKHTKNKFYFVYIVFMCATGILFAEIPMLVARIQVLASRQMLPGSFYLWLVKDVVFIGVIAVLAYVQRFGQRYLRIPCKPSLDNKHVFFQPEKRDKYISQHRRSLYEQSLRQTENSQSDSDNEKESSLPKCKSVPNISSCDRAEHLPLTASKSTTHLDKLNSSSTKETNFMCKMSNIHSSLKHYGAKLKSSGVNKANKPKRVSFKVELGKGRFFQIKARSDSPPVYHDATVEASTFEK